MSRFSLILTLLLGIGLGTAWPQESREKKAGTRPAEKSPATSGSSVPAAAPSPAPGSLPSPSPKRGSTDSRLRKYAESLLRQYDKNKNGVLEKDEWREMSSPWHDADRNRDGTITLDELVSRMSQFDRRGPEMTRPQFSPSFPPSARIESPGVGGPPFPTGRSFASLGMSNKPLDPSSPTVAMRLLIADLVVDSGGSSAARNLSGPVEIDLAASNEKVKEALGKMGLRGPWEVFRRLELSSADGQAAYIDVGQSEPTITGVNITTFGRTNSLSYKNTGFIVGAQPNVGPSGTITVEVDVSASRQGSDDEGVPIAAPAEGETVKSLPVHQVLSRSIVRVPDGKTVVVAAISQAGARRRELVILLSARVVPRKAD